MGRPRGGGLVNYYTIVTFGYAPAVKTSGGGNRVFRSREAAAKACRVPRGVTALVYACDTRALALSADISVVRDGERIA